MLSIISDAMLAATRNEKWTAPDHWRADRPRGRVRPNGEDPHDWRRYVKRDRGYW